MGHLILRELVQFGFNSRYKVRTALVLIQVFLDVTL
jgi:hypothetical protein